VPNQPKQEALSDVALLQASAAGDRSTFDTFVDRHKAALFRFTRHLCDSDGDAEEALQQTFVAAWMNADSFRADGHVRGWLFRIARNAHYKMHRKKAGEPTEHEELTALGCRAGWNTDARPLSQSIEDRDLVRHALASLNPEDRETLLLIELEGFSLREASDTLSITLPAVKSRLHRARLRLVAAMREDTADVE